MKQRYAINLLLWLMIVSIMSRFFVAQAQTAQPPVRQWQRVVEASGLSLTSTVQAVKSTGGFYGVLAEKNLVLLSATGDIVWNKAVPGSYADSSTNRVALQKTLALAPTQDGGFVVLALDVANRYYVTKLDSAGNNLWTKTVARANAGPTIQITQDALAASSDGGFLLVGSYTDVLSYVTMTKLSADGFIVNQWRVKFSGPSALTTPLIRQILPTPNQGYLLVGRSAGNVATNSQALAVQVNEQYNVAWQRVYPNLSAFQAVVAKERADNTYIAIGPGINNSGLAVTLSPNQAGDGTLLTSLPNMASLVSLVNDGAGNVTLLDQAPTNNGDFRLTNGRLPTFTWTKNFGGSGVDVPTALLATDDGGYLAVGTTTSTDGDVAGKSTGNVAVWVLKLGTLLQTTTLRLLAPVYDCQTGFIRFQTTGGDGSPISYVTPGITRASLTDPYGTVEPGLRNDPKVITIQAAQSGQTVSYAFDLGAYCRATQPASTASTDTLRLIAPTYSCQTGAITFHSVGGDGSPIEYAAAGVTSWTTNPNQFVDRELRTAYDAQPLTLMARQNGKIVTYVFNLKAACGRARIGETEPTDDLTVTLLGNPIREMAQVEILGAEGLSVGFQLFDASGHLVEKRTIEQASHPERQTFDLRRQAAGTLLLHTTINGQIRTIKMVKQ